MAVVETLPMVPPIEWIEDYEDTECPTCFVTVGLARSGRTKAKTGHRQYHIQIDQGMQLAARGMYKTVTRSDQ